MLLLLYLAVAAGGAMILAPLAGRLAARVGAEDRPDLARKVHREVTPRLGGLAILAGALLAVGAAVLSGSPGGERIAELPVPIAGLGVAALLIAAVGFADDVWTLSPWVKLAGELAAAGVAWAAGFRIETLDLGLGAVRLGPLAAAATILWMVAAMNALNLIDGLDGLAATMALLAVAPLAIQAVLASGPVAAVVAVALAGGVAGFLVHNAPPARQFMGSCGSLLIGLVLACLAVGTLRGKVGFNPAVPALALGVPLLDTFLAVLRRVARGENPMRADRQHLHHRLLDAGFGPRRAVAALAAVQGFFSLLAVASLLLPRELSLVPLVPAAVAAALLAHRLGYGALISGRRGRG
ncbi:MAG: undecaprenyl/decaprenyl-phosphate alpha-N-acetylglucosaminyl 1-phosphate transferase [Acidobacteria bacterium]|nr:MAG: undecaprenyl/decaprenyl-phosphate alpha-N-acetylglucosaminyl 1-phosphate transferase [Acidobacteriota bacterium]